MIVACIDCGESFAREPDEDWKVRCVKCWRASKGFNGDGLGSMRSTIVRLKTENEELRAMVAELEESHTSLYKHIGFLIFACHPDRNPGREGNAHEVMVWLLRKREEFGA